MKRRDLFLAVGGAAITAALPSQAAAESAVARTPWEFRIRIAVEPGDLEVIYFPAEMSFDECSSARETIFEKRKTNVLYGGPEFWYHTQPSSRLIDKVRVARKLVLDQHFVSDVPVCVTKEYGTSYPSVQVDRLTGYEFCFGTDRGTDRFLLTRDVSQTRERWEALRFVTIYVTPESAT